MSVFGVEVFCRSETRTTWRGAANPSVPAVEPYFSIGICLFATAWCTNNNHLNYLYEFVCNFSRVGSKNLIADTVLYREAHLAAAYNRNHLFFGGADVLVVNSFSSPRDCVIDYYDLCSILKVKYQRFVH